MKEILDAKEDIAITRNGIPVATLCFDQVPSGDSILNSIKYEHEQLVEVIKQILRDHFVPFREVMNSKKENGKNTPEKNLEKAVYASEKNLPLADAKIETMCDVPGCMRTDVDVYEDYYEKEYTLCPAHKGKLQTEQIL